VKLLVEDLEWGLRRNARCTLRATVATAAHINAEELKAAQAVFYIQITGLTSSWSNIVRSPFGNHADASTGAPGNAVEADAAEAFVRFLTAFRLAGGADAGCSARFLAFTRCTAMLMMLSTTAKSAVSSHSSSRASVLIRLLMMNLPSIFCLEPHKKLLLDVP